MKVLGIDPAPAKKSLVFDGREFYSFDVTTLINYLESEKERDSLFISWDAPLSAAIDKKNFSLTIRKIERFFNRSGRYAKRLEIPEGISTLGYSGCPHWTISQYIFGLPILNPSLQISPDYKLLMSNDRLDFSISYITEIHPALSMWILLKEKLADNPLFKNSWKYKGDSSSDTKRRRAILIESILSLELTQEYLLKKISIESDDALDSFVCWLLGTAFVAKDKRVKVYGDDKNGSFLLPLDKEIEGSLENYLISKGSER